MQFVCMCIGVKCVNVHYVGQNVHKITTLSSHLFLLCLTGECITGQATGHLPAKCRETKESRRTAPRLQTSDVTVAIFPLSPSHPPSHAAPLPLPCHCDCVFLSTVGQRLTQHLCFKRVVSFQKIIKSSTNSYNVVDSTDWKQRHGA